MLAILEQKWHCYVVCGCWYSKLDSYISQGSMATCSGCGGIFTNAFVAVKAFQKMIKSVSHYKNLRSLSSCVFNSVCLWYKTAAVKWTCFGWFIAWLIVWLVRSRDVRILKFLVSPQILIKDSLLRLQQERNIGSTVSLCSHWIHLVF